MKRIISSLMVVIMVAAILSSCDGSNSVDKKIKPYPVAVSNVTVEKAPKAVASLSPILTKILTDLGYTAKIVGYSDGDVLPEIPKPKVVSEPQKKFRWFWEKKPEPVSQEPVKQLPNGEIGTALKPNLEKIGEYVPEIIFTTAPITKAQMSKLDAVKIKVVVIPAAKNLEELKANYISIIKVMSGQLEADKKAKTFIEETQHKIDYIKSVVPEPKLSFLYVCTIDPIISTGDTYESSLISCVATNLAGDFKDYTVTKEELATLDPDVILFSSDLNKENIIQSEMFKSKKAVKEDKLIQIDKALLTDQTQNVANSIKSIAKLMYPSTDFEEPVPQSSSEQSKKKK